MLDFVDELLLFDELEGPFDEDRVDRAELGLNAPAHGLYFVEAIYP